MKGLLIRVFKVWVLVLALGLTLALGACNGSSEGKVTVVNPYIREVPAGKHVTAAFVTLQNNTAEDCQLTGATAPFASRIEVHAHRHEQGLMRMEKLDYLMIESGGSAKLSPGGNHLMIMGLNQPLVKQQRRELVLNFINCPNQLVEFAVKSVLDE